MYEKQQDLVYDVVNEISICADMIGKKNINRENVYGFVPGLNESETARELERKISDIEKGIFQVMFTGCFSAGKSTLLNALMHRELLRTGALPETAVITKLVFNADRNHVVVYKRDKVDDKTGAPVTETLYDIRDFFSKYRVDPKDTTRFLRLVDHVELYLTGDGIGGSTVQLVDSPGTRATAADDEVSKKFAKHADAIVFLISALAPLDKYDKEYIRENFYNRQMKNVFFVVNKTNQLNDDEQIDEVKKYVKNELHDVFLDEKGRFDEYLYQNRVFYVDAFGAMNTRLGRETPITNKYKVWVDDNETGVPEFEMALSEFLTSDDKAKAALRAYCTQMANVFKLAEFSVENQLTVLRNGLNNAELLKKNFEEDKGRIQRELEEIEKSIKYAEREIMRDAEIAYDNFTNAVDSEWTHYFTDEKINGMGIEFMSLLWGKIKTLFSIGEDKEIKERKLDEATQEATKKFVAGIMSFIKEKNETQGLEFRQRMEADIDELSRKLEEHQQIMGKLHIPINIEDILNDIVKESQVGFQGPHAEKASLSQVFLTLLIGGIDPEAFVTAAEGNKKMGAFLVMLIKINIIDVLILMIGTALIGNIALVPFIIYKGIRGSMSKDEIMKKIIANTKTLVLDGGEDRNGNRIPGLKGEGKAQYLNKINATIGGAMRRTAKELSCKIEGKMGDIERKLQESIVMLEENENAYQMEKERMGNILDTMVESISRISILINGIPLDREGIHRLATRVN